MIDWLDLLAVHGTLKSLLQHHSSKALILWHSVFFMVQLSHSYLTTVNIAAMNIGIHVPFSVMVSSEYVPSGGIAGTFGSFIP